MKLKKIYWSVALVCLVFGVVLAMQYRMNNAPRYNDSIRRTQDLANQVEQLEREQDVLQTQLSRMRTELEQLSTGPLSSQLKAEMEPAMVLSGLCPVAGPGVEVTLNDSDVTQKLTGNPNMYIVHDEDILKVVNELKAAGAEAIAINDQRLVAASEISCSGPVIRINKKALVPPYRIIAIGNPDTLAGALSMRGGVAEYLQFFGIQISVKKLEQMTIPAYSGRSKKN